MRASTSSASNERMARPMASPSMVFCPAMPGCERVEQAAGGRGVAGEGDEDVGRAAEDDEADAVVAAVGDEAVEHRLHPVEAGCRGRRPRRRSRGSAIEPEMSTASMTSRAASVRSIGGADPLGAGEGEQDERPEQPGEGHLQPRARQHDRALALVEAGARPLEEGDAHGLHHLAARRSEPEHEERQRQREERPGEGELKHGGGAIQWRAAASAARPSKAGGPGGRARGEGGGEAAEAAAGAVEEGGPGRAGQGRHLGAREGDERGAADQRGRGGRARRGRRLEAGREGVRARPGRRGGRRWRGGGGARPRAPRARSGEEERGERRPRPRWRAIIETGGRLDDVLELVEERRPGFRPGPARVHQPSAGAERRRGGGAAARSPRRR